MSDRYKSIASNRLCNPCGTIYFYTTYAFWLIESIPVDDEYQPYFYVNCKKGWLEYQPFRYEDVYRIPMDIMFDLSTLESAIQSLKVFHHDFLTEHNITIEADKTPVESMGLPEGFDV